MRIWLTWILLLGLGIWGCARKGPRSNRWTGTGGNAAFDSQTTSKQNPIITPERGLVGKVARVNLASRFVVLTFPLGRLPALEQRFDVYRAGLKCGEVKIVGPRRDDNVVADIVAGNAEVGDEVREH